MAEIDLAKLGSPANSCGMAGSITGAGAGLAQEMVQSLVLVLSTMSPPRLSINAI